MTHLKRSPGFDETIAEMELAGACRTTFCCFNKTEGPEGADEAAAAMVAALMIGEVRNDELGTMFMMKR